MIILWISLQKHGNNVEPTHRKCTYDQNPTIYPELGKARPIAPWLKASTIGRICPQWTSLLLLAWHARYAEDVCKNEYRVEQNPNGQSKDSRISDSDRLKARARGVLSTARLQNKTHDTLRYNSYCTYLTSELPCAFAWRVVFFF
jgi:hypothetical protein